MGASWYRSSTLRTTQTAVEKKPHIACRIVWQGYLADPNQGFGGLKGIGGTSLKRELRKWKQSVSMDKVRIAARKHFEEVFGIKLEPMGEGA